MSDYYDINDGDNLFDFDDEVDPFAAPHIPSHTMFDTDSETDMDEDQNQTPSCPIQLKNTRRLRGTLTGNIAAKVLSVLSSMESVGLNLPLFLDFLSWGDQECVVNAKIRYERTALMAARPVMEEFAFSCVTEVVEKELQGIQELSLCPSDEVSDSGLTRFLIEDMVLKLSSPAPGSTPKLWALLQKVSRVKGQDRKRTKKSSDLTNRQDCPAHPIHDLPTDVCAIAPPQSLAEIPDHFPPRTRDISKVT
ncbi:hypothetical protein BU15DRAFT_61923 [Melanogaster broomeanus]|nr:hypothetical protein BU15DRAFT_61923 [Melanogaster broomeanus]